MSFKGTASGTPDATATAAAVANVMGGGLRVIRWFKRLFPIKYVRIEPK